MKNDNWLIFLYTVFAIIFCLIIEYSAKAGEYPLFTWGETVHFKLNTPNEKCMPGIIKERKKEGNDWQYFFGTQCPCMGMYYCFKEGRFKEGELQI